MIMIISPAILRHFIRLVRVLRPRMRFSVSIG